LRRPRILRLGAPFIIYDNGFFGEMQEAESAKQWFASSYLTTQTNLIDVVESGRESLESLEAFLARELEPFFRSCTDGVGHFRFGGLISILRRRALARGSDD
jgi:hypothetical protein